MKRRVMFLGYYMFLFSQTIKEEILPTPLLPTEIPIPAISDTGKYRYRKNKVEGNVRLQIATNKKGYF